MTNPEFTPKERRILIGLMAATGVTMVLGSAAVGIVIYRLLTSCFGV